MLYCLGITTTHNCCGIRLVVLFSSVRVYYHRVTFIPIQVKPSRIIPLSFVHSTVIQIDVTSSKFVCLLPVTLHWFTTVIDSDPITVYLVCASLRISAARAHDTLVGICLWL